MQLYFNREAFIKEKTEQFDRKDTTCSDEEYGPGEALAVEEFTEMKDKINVIDNKFGRYLHLKPLFNSLNRYSIKYCFISP